MTATPRWVIGRRGNGIVLAAEAVGAMKPADTADAGVAVAVVARVAVAV